MSTPQGSNEKSIFISLAGMIQRFCQRVENLPKRIPEMIACITYVIAHIFISFFHERWYDEAVAWQIAKCASIKDILFEIPHYEGHPPLWHMILVPFAKLGAPYELSLGIVSLLFAGTACCLIIWKSPFPRIIRLLLPFTYFFFFQYGVISRPYCVMMLAFVLLAMAHKKRDTKPGIYVTFLMLLCLTSAYGILIAGGLTIAWILEMWNSQKIVDFVKKMLRDKRTMWLFVLLLFALLVVAVIMPRETTAATSDMGKSYKIEGLIRCILYMFFALPSEVTMTSVYSEYQFLKNMQIPWASLAITCLLGISIWFFIIKFGKRKKTLLTLLIPYVMYAAFAAAVYVCNHHIGIGLYIFVFWFWISFDKEINVDFSDIIEKGSEYNKKLISAIMVLFGGFIVIISLSWNVITCVQEVLYSYSIGKNEAEFIKENGLDNYRIMAGFSVTYKDGKVKDMDVNQFMFVDNIAPYFDHNIFFNVNNGEDSLSYSTHQKANKEEEKQMIENWQTQPPDVLYMYPSIELIYEDIDLHAYKVVYHQENYRLWKGFLNYEASKIYAHDDLIEELGLETCGGETFAKMLLYNN